MCRCIRRRRCGRRGQRDGAKRRCGSTHVRRSDRVADDVQPCEIHGAYGRNVDRQPAAYCRDKLGFCSQDRFVIGCFADEIFGDRGTTIGCLIGVTLRLRICEVQREFSTQPPLVPHLCGDDARNDLYVGRAPESHSSLRPTRCLERRAPKAPEAPNVQPVPRASSIVDAERVQSRSSIAHSEEQGQLFGATDTYRFPLS